MLYDITLALFSSHSKLSGMAKLGFLLNLADESYFDGTMSQLCPPWQSIGGP